MKIIFFGTPQFAANVLTFLMNHGIHVVAVVTKPDRPKGRSAIPLPTPVKLVAQAQSSIPVFQPPLVSAPEFADTLAAFQADLFVVVAYGEIIKQHLLDMPKKGCINLHASLLPKYRGAAPIQHSILNGDSKTGVTIIHMAKKMDAGDMIKKVEIPIGPNDAFPKIEQDLCAVGSQALLEVIHDFSKGQVSSIPQDHSQATFAPKIELEDCELHWKESAFKLHNLIRAVSPEPGAWCYVTIRNQKKRLKILSSRVVSELQGSPGQILSYGKNDFIVACGEQALALLEVQLEGKKVMKAGELALGIPQDNFLFN